MRIIWAQMLKHKLLDLSPSASDASALGAGVKGWENANASGPWITI